MWMVFLCICCSLMISYNRGIVEAAETLKNVEDLDIEQELKIINRPAVKIIKVHHHLTHHNYSYVIISRFKDFRIVLYINW